MIYKQLGPSPEYPEEPNALKRFVLQAHFRGRSVHLDFRVALNGHAEGWTISAAREGVIKAPVVTFQQAKRVVEDQDLWKFDLETGLVFPREVETTIQGKKRTVIRPGSLYAERKAQLIPKEWLGIEGRTELPPDWPDTILEYWDSWDQATRRELESEGFDPDWANDVIEKKAWKVKEIPVGATRSFPGVFVIMDTGTLTLGARKPYFFEYFPEERSLLPSRIVFRLVARAKSAFEEALLKDAGAIVLPPGVEEEVPRTPGYWVYSTPDPRPYVLSEEALEKEWLPPHGVAALPAKIVRAVPRELRFWEMEDDEERFAAREALMDWWEEEGERLMKKGEISAAQTTRFRLLEQTYRGPIVIRWGPSTLLYYFLLADPKLVVTLENSPLLRNEVAGLELDGEYWDPLWEIKDTFEPEPGTLLNPSKETPSRIRVVDEGEAIVMEQEPGFLRLQLQGDKLEGYYTIAWEDPDAPFIVFRKAKEIEVKKEGKRAVLQLHSWLGGQHWDLRLEEEGRLIEFHFPSDPGLEPSGIASLSECADMKWLDIDRETVVDGTLVKPLAAWLLEWVERADDHLRFKLGDREYLAQKLPDGTWFVGPIAQASLTFEPKFSSDYEQIVYGVVLSPYGPDAHGDMIDASEIRKAAHRYLAFGRQVGLHHLGEPIEAYVVESYIAPQDLVYENGAIVRKGEWVIAVHIPDRSVWERVLAGEFRGFSIQGWGVREPLEIP